MKWYTETDLRDFEPIWLLELVMGGKVYRFASQTTSIDDDDGALLFDGTLSDVDFVSEMEFASDDFELPSASCTVVFRDDLAKRIAQGADLGAATAELSLFRKDSDDDYDDRQVVVAGRVALPAYGAKGEPVALSIEADWLADSLLKPDAEHIVDSSVWGRADDNAEGAIFPMIFGAPGSQTFAGSPIYVIDYDSGSGVTIGLVAGHLVTAANINVVRVKGDDGTQSVAGESVLNAIDGNGVTYSYVVLTGQYAAGDSYFARFDVDGGGFINPFRRETASATATQVGFLQTAGDILRYLLHLSGVKVDDGKTAAAAELLTGYELDFFIGERVDVMEFIKSEILPLIPCSLRASSEGIYPVVWRYDATSADAKAKLVSDRHIY